MRGPNSTEINKIDSLAVSGLSGVADSLAYKVHEIEKHFHVRNICYGKAAGDNFLEDSLTPFVVTAGSSSAFGSETLCHDGTVVESGSTTKKMDMGRIVVYATSAAAGKAYVLQLLYGTGAIGTASVCTSLYFVVPGTSQTRASGIVVPCPRVTCNNKIWAKCKCETDGATMSIFLDIHTYPG